MKAQKSQQGLDMLAEAKTLLDRKLAELQQEIDDAESLNQNLHQALADREAQLGSHEQYDHDM